ncbi:hypothetical protein JTB14_003508 [Gonioctena quinquepunctata]|nr:hypothetical protein JTB14_003508 [Gonioctena quinquepunctata]
MEEFKNALDKVDWSIYYNQENSDPYVSMNTLTQTYQTLVTKHFPLEKVEEQNKPPDEWFNQELRQMRELISKLKTVYEASKTVTNKAIFNGYKNNYRNTIIQTKKKA